MLQLLTLQQTVKKQPLRICSYILLTIISASCANERPVYHGAEYYKNLQVPPDLTEPDTADQLRVPDPSEEALQRFRDNNKLETVITPKFDGVRVVNYAGNSWIEVDNNVEHVWTRLLQFWEIEGIDVVTKRPLLGYMDTDWVKRIGPESGYFTSMFQSFEPDQKDRFRVRLERFDDGAKTRLFLAHYRIEKTVSGEFDDNISWVSRPSDLEAEREIIARMALFAGLTKEQLKQLLENYQPYASLIKIDSGNTTAFTMSGSMDFVWRRTLRALDRMQMQDIQQQQESSSINFVAAKISDKDIDVETDDLSESSWLMKLFTGSSDEVDDEKREFRVELSEVSGRVLVQVKDNQNTQYTDEDGDVTGTARAEQLRDVLVKYME